MEVNNLWQKLVPDSNRIEKIKKDLEIGVAPHLPYFLVGLKEEKEVLGKMISRIDNHMQICLLKAQYGNGKTNLLKYLENFFGINTQYNIHSQTWRADVDKYNINLFLLYIIQQSYFEVLKTFLMDMREEDLAKACIEFNGSMSALRGYADAINQNRTSEDCIAELIQLGTGFKTDKNCFKKYGLEKFNDYNRLDVLKFFLNVFAFNEYFILFCIDELEKIMEKSRARFQTFLTSYRELIDEASCINGHMVITAMTDASRSSEASLESYNPAFERRIKSLIVTLSAIENKDDIKELAVALCDILQKECDSQDIETLVNGVLKHPWGHTNEVVIDVYKRLSNPSMGWIDYIKKAKLEDSLQEKIAELKADDVMTRINAKFFSPIEEYMQIFGEDGITYTIKAQTFQTVRKIEDQKAYVFLFTNDLNSNINRILNVKQLYPSDSLIIFAPKGLGLSNSSLEEAGISGKSAVITYDPLVLMALMELFLEDYENDNIKEAINLYTRGL